jgi:hypothetical protein
MLQRGSIPVDQVAQFVLELCSISAPTPNRSHILTAIIILPATIPSLRANYSRRCCCCGSIFLLAPPRTPHAHLPQCGIRASAIG